MIQSQNSSRFNSRLCFRARHYCGHLSSAAYEATILFLSFFFSEKVSSPLHAASFRHTTGGGSLTAMGVRASRVTSTRKALLKPHFYEKLLRMVKCSARKRWCPLVGRAFANFTQPPRSKPYFALNYFVAIACNCQPPPSAL